MPKDWHLLWFIKDLSILFPNHKTWPNINIITSPNSIVYEFDPVNIGIFTCSEYSARKGATVPSSDVNYIGRMFLPKKCVSPLLYILFEHASQ